MKNHQKKVTPLSIFLMLIFIVVIPFLPLLLSRQWNWLEAWAYAIISILGFIISRLLAAKHHPDLIKERSQFMQQADVVAWDKILSPLVGLGGGLILLVAGLDALYNWSMPFHIGLKISSLVVILLGYALGSYALIANRFFSGTVRIQNDRGQHVISGGPYRWVRHPGYAGAVLTYLATPCFLDSIWAFLPAIVIVSILILRTSLEDQYLQEKLPGYQDYVKQVRYRLFPGIW